MKWIFVVLTLWVLCFQTKAAFELEEASCWEVEGDVEDSETKTQATYFWLLTFENDHGKQYSTKKLSEQKSLLRADLHTGKTRSKDFVYPPFSPPDFV